MARLVVTVISLLLLACLCLAQDDRITFLPEYGPLTEDNVQYAGYIETAPNSALFYWFVRAQLNADAAPLAIWLNGGPGCSSMTGLFVENGPYYFAPGGLRLIENPYSWHRKAHMLFIDQPLGTGYSYTTDNYAENEDDVATTLYTFLQRFLAKHPEYAASQLFLTGESYAGKYVPAFANHILDMNAKRSGSDIHLNLAGLLIGDGFVHPIVQRMVFSHQAYWSGMISEKQLYQMRHIEEKCKASIASGNTAQKGTPCDHLMEFIMVAGGYPDNYDLRSFDPPYNRSQKIDYLNRQDVREALHVGNLQPVYEGCSDVVYDHLKYDIMRTVLPVIPRLVANMPVVFFNGNFDLRDGPTGTERFLRQLNINNFKEANRNIWAVENRVAGFDITAGNLTLLVVHGAGHFAPRDQPKNTLDMFERFISNTPFCLPGETYTNANGQIKSCNPSSEICNTFLDNCNGNGHCMNGHCVCNDGWTGPSCASVLSTFSLDKANDKKYTLKPHDLVVFSFEVTKPLISAYIQVEETVATMNSTIAALITSATGTDATAHDTFCIFVHHTVPTTTEYTYASCSNSTEHRLRVQLSAGEWHAALFNGRNVQSDVFVDYVSASTIEDGGSDMFVAVIVLAGAVIVLMVCLAIAGYKLVTARQRYTYVQ